jgi:hypothetical protein
LKQMGSGGGDSEKREQEREVWNWKYKTVYIFWVTHDLQCGTDSTKEEKQKQAEIWAFTQELDLQFMSLIKLNTR